MSDMADQSCLSSMHVHNLCKLSMRPDDSSCHAASGHAVLARPNPHSTYRNGPLPCNVQMLQQLKNYHRGDSCVQLRSVCMLPLRQKTLSWSRGIVIPVLVFINSNSIDPKPPCSRTLWRTDGTSWAAAFKLVAAAYQAPA